ncbi:MAG: hypothetical protein RBS42_01985 [Campylobacterales bacterium]|nr:hypothetical protein [Campylobacterales bacterium]
MKSLKNHFAVIFPLLVLLFAFQFTKGLDSVVVDYEEKIIDEYSILLVTAKDFKYEELYAMSSKVKNVEEVSPKKVLDNLKKDISAENISLIQLALPKFYSVKLSSFPSDKERVNIEEKLLKAKGVKRVEAFSKTYNQIYKLLSVAKTLTYIFASIIGVIALLLMLKQMRIWVLEHKERMDIMTLFGAAFWMKSAVLYRLALVDSLFSTICVVLFFWFVPKYKLIQEFADDIGLIVPTIDPLKDGVLLLAISIFFALISVSLVMLKVKNEQP